MHINHSYKILARHHIFNIGFCSRRRDSEVHNGRISSSSPNILQRNAFSMQSCLFRSFFFLIPFGEQSFSFIQFSSSSLLQFFQDRDRQLTCAEVIPTLTGCGYIFSHYAEERWAAVFMNWAFIYTNRSTPYRTQFHTHELVPDEAQYIHTPKSTEIQSSERTISN